MEQGETDMGDTLYCICRSSDVERFMIGCDHCEEWYHGDCIGVTQLDAKQIKRYYCEACRARNSSLQIKYKSKKKEVEKPPPAKNRDKQDKDIKKRQSRKCGQCSSCLKTEDCGKCDFCKDMKKFGGSNKWRQKCKQRQCLVYVSSAEGKMAASTSEQRLGSDSSGLDDGFDDDDANDNDDEERKQKSKTTPKKQRERKNSTDVSPRKKKKVKQKENAVQEKKPRQKSSSRRYVEIDDALETDDEVPRQCYGPGCLEPARLGSKYCSDDCGMKLAKSRIYEILPSRIQQWQSSPCVGEENNKKCLEKLRNETIEARMKLRQLDDKIKDLDSLVERGKRLAIENDQEAAEQEEDTELSIYCVTCGSEISQKGALKHMEKCYLKFEAQTSFWSLYQTRIEGNSMFCDFYNPQQKMYCKRLKILCPEHTKEPKVSPDSVCGSPIPKEVFDEGELLCRVSKRKCTKHYCWEKLRRAEIDMQRLRQWMKLDDLFEQERNIRMAMSNRMGVLGLMLHQTVDHDPTRPMKSTPA